MDYVKVEVSTGAKQPASKNGDSRNTHAWEKETRYFVELSIFCKKFKSEDEMSHLMCPLRFI